MWVRPWVYSRSRFIAALSRPAVMRELRDILNFANFKDNCYFSVICLFAGLSAAIK